MKARETVVGPLAILGALLGCVAVSAFVATFLLSGSAPIASDTGEPRYDTSALVETRAREPGRTSRSTLVAPVPSPELTPSAVPAPSPEPATPTITPLALGATATPSDAVTSDPAAPPAPVGQLACPPYPILLNPDPDLVAATQGAMDMWARHLDCKAFEISSAGLDISYHAGWPGVCQDPDIAACTMNGIFLSPVPPLYDAESVIAHELGHVLNLEHDEGPGLMDPGLWNGPGTIWCDVNIRCAER